MSAPPKALDAAMGLREAAAVFASTGESALPVLDTAGEYDGILASRDLMDALAAGEDSRTGDLLTRYHVTSTEPVGQVLRMLDGDAEAVAVVDGDLLVGWVRHRDVLAALGAAQARAK